MSKKPKPETSNVVPFVNPVAISPDRADLTPLLVGWAPWGELQPEGGRIVVLAKQVSLDLESGRPTSKLLILSGSPEFGDKDDQALAPRSWEVTLEFKGGSVPEFTKALTALHTTCQRGAWRYAVPFEQAVCLDLALELRALGESTPEVPPPGPEDTGAAAVAAGLEPAGDDDEPVNDDEIPCEDLPSY